MWVCGCVCVTESPEQVRVLKEPPPAGSTATGKAQGKGKGNGKSKGKGSSSSKTRYRLAVITGSNMGKPDPAKVVGLRWADGGNDNAAAGPERWQMGLAPATLQPARPTSGELSAEVHTTTLSL